MRRDRIEERLAGLEKDMKAIRSEQGQAIESLREELRNFQEVILEDRIAYIHELARRYEDIALDGAISDAARSFEVKMSADCPPQYERQKCIDGLVDELRDDAARLKGTGDIDECIKSIVVEDCEELEGFKGTACERCLDAYFVERDELIGLAQKFARCKADLISRGKSAYLSQLPDDVVISKIVEPLSHEARFRMLKSLAEGHLSFKDLAGVSGFDGGHLIYHLNKLSGSGLIAKTDEGKYAISEKGLGIMDLVKKLYER